MSTTLPADTPITGDLSPDQIADYIDLAAKLVDREGLEVGDYWTDGLTRDYHSDSSCCTAGALAVVCGYRRTALVERDFVGVRGYDIETGDWLPDEPHPVFAAALKALGFRYLEDLYTWSDTSSADEVIEALHTAAWTVRGQQAGAAS